jgi:hypothetical protein
MKLAKVLQRLAAPEDHVPETPFNLMDELHAFLISPAAREQRATGSFYPSGLDGCHRAMAYNFLRAPVNDVHLEPRLIITFELGNHIHERFQWMFDKLAKARGWQFNPEVRILRGLNPWFISGRCDGLFELPQKEGIEIKSIHKAGFDRLYNGPLYEHEEQGNTYCGILKIPRMHYLYVCKDNSQTKTFARPFNRTQFESTITKIERILLRLQDFRLPKRITPDCVDPRCRFRVVCWQEKMTVERLANDETAAELEEWKPVILHGRLARGKAA